MRECRRIGMLTSSMLVALLAACGSDSQPPTGSGNNGGDGEVGSIQVTTETSGELDPDGYFVAVDGGSTRPIGANGSLTFTDVPVGDHEVAISGLALNCSVDGVDSKATTVLATATSTVSFSILCDATSLIAFQGPGGIYTIGPDAAQADLLVEGGYPRWSPDGATIAFKSPQSLHLDVISRDGTGQRQIADLQAVAGDFDWSPDGTRLVYDAGDGFDASIYIAQVDGSGSVRVTNAAQADREPVWSPNGTWIAFERFSGEFGGPEIYRINADGSNETQLTTNPEYDEDPVWSPDATQIAFKRGYDEGGESYAAIFTMNSDGSALLNVSGGLGGDEDPVWSPDGTRIAFSSYRNGSRDIYVVNADGSGLLRLSSEPATSDRYPTWSPDGSRLAFCQSAKDGTGSFISILNADGSGDQRVLPVEGCRPVWSPRLY